MLIVEAAFSTEIDLLEMEKQQDDLKHLRFGSILQTLQATLFLL